MIVNFKTCVINQGTRKLVRTPMLIKKQLIMPLNFQNYTIVPLHNRTIMFCHSVVFSYKN